MILNKLVEGLKPAYIKGNAAVEITGVAYDSRKVKSGTLFVCIAGTKADGHDFIQSAAENGAAALLVQKDVEAPEGVAVVRIDDTRYGLAYVSDALFGHPSGKFSLIGVTGTKGKTTTTFMIKSILEMAGRKVGLVGTLGTRIGDEVLYSERTTPESYDLQALFHEMTEKNVDTAVMEVSSQGLALHRVSCTDYDTGIFTNLSKDHISEHEHADMREYLEAKAKLFLMCKKGIVNIDNEYGKEIIKTATCEILTLGIDNDADIRALDVVKKPDSVEFRAVTPWFEGSFKVNIPGKFSVYNALCAIGACALAGIDMESIKAGLERVNVPGRAEIVEIGRPYTVIIDYAHTPDSLENILSTVKSFTPGRLISLFGCGGDRDRTKRPIMGEISGKIADYTVITSDNPRTEEPAAIIREIEEGIKNTSAQYTAIQDRREAIRHALLKAQAGDVIVLAGKGHETYQTFKDKTIHFDEREVVRELLDEIK